MSVKYEVVLEWRDPDGTVMRQLLSMWPSGGTWTEQRCLQAARADASRMRRGEIILLKDGKPVI